MQCARAEPASFWRENVMIIKVVILILVLGRMSVVAKTKVIKCQEYLFHLAIGTGDGFTSLDGNKRTNFCGKKKYNHDAVFRGVYQLMNDGQQRKPGNHQFPLLLITCRGFLNKSSGAGVGVGKGCSREFLGGVPPSSPNPDPISDQKMSFSTSVFRPGSGCSNAILRINWVLTFNTIQRKTN